MITDNIFVNILLFVMLSSFVLQLFYYLFFLTPLLFFKNKKSLKQPKVSLIIAAKNERHNLEKNLKIILNQDYPDFEVILVDDNSNDNTKDFINTLKQEYSNLFYYKTRVGKTGKKDALSLGINKSSTNNLVFTDADCYPIGKDWISNLMSNANSHTEILLAYGKYQTENSFLNKIIRFDTLHIAITYFNLTLRGMPYMAVGRNLYYKKDLWIKGNGFNSHKDILSGDDDLFINQHAKSAQFDICINPDSFTISESKKTLKEWSKQKTRHFSTSSKYTLKTLLLLNFEIVTKFLFFLSFIPLLCLIKISYLYNIILSIFAIREILVFSIYFIHAKLLREKKLWYLILIFDISLPLFYLYFFIKQKTLKKHTEWK